MSRFFIERPIFAWVIAVVIMIAGALAITSLPVAQYPAIAPPAVTVTANYTGASAETLQNSVTQVIEQQLKGLDHLLYFSSASTSDGQVQITATFDAGANPDIAQVQVQNKVQQATALLPQEVQQQGITVAKTQNAILLVVALSDRSGHYSHIDIADMMVSRMQDPLARVSGVGDLQVFGGQYAIRIWLDPYKLNSFKLMPSDVVTAVTAQNVQVSAGELGGLPAAPGQGLNATITAQSRLQTPEQFQAIVLRTRADGSVVRLSDVARVEMGAESYSFNSRMNALPAAGIAIHLAPGANALTTADGVKKRAAELVATMPAGLHLSFPVDNTSFVRLSIHQVESTLMEAIILVVVVMFLFLQNWRATLIPAIAVPVVLLGTFGVLAVLGYSINTLTMFAMVLAIGLLVDDAIVVVENVERLMTEEGLSPKAAAHKSMDEITGALIGIALVLSAVFLPMAFFGGSTGVIYRQFSVTIISAMMLSVLVALVLTPALCATLLKPTKAAHSVSGGGFFGGFNRIFAALVSRYTASVGRLIGRPLPALIGYGVLLVILGFFFLRLPTSFLPEEDQGAVISIFTLPAGAVETRSLAVLHRIEQHFLVDERANTADVFGVVGFSFGGAGQNTGLVWSPLKDWEQRPGAKNTAAAIALRGNQTFSQIRDARVFTVVPPAVQELGNATGFDLELEDQGGIGHQRLVQARNQLLGMAAADPLLVAVRPSGQEDTPQLHLDVDLVRAGALGLNQTDINDTLQAATGGRYINDFIDRGRVKRVYMQGDAPYRSSPEDIGRWYVRTSSGDMAPFSAFSTSRWVMGPAELERFNGLPSLDIQGQAASGESSGAAMAEMEKLIKRLPAGVGFEWTGLSFQEVKAGSGATELYVLSIVVIFLCLAALYESWSIPMAILLVIPLGVIGAVLAATLRGLYNDIFFQVGLLTTIGLSAKNAILIVEFAIDAERRGANPIDAAMEAARLRLRPILMTSLAFIAGVTPLALSTGAGAASRVDIGTGVLGGMLAATVLAIFFVPLFYVGVRRVFKDRVARHSPAAGAVGEDA